MHVFDNAKKSGAPGMIRTCDLLVRSQTLYPTELRARDPHYSKGRLFLSRRRRCFRRFPQCAHLDSAIDLALPLTAIARFISVVC
jgi:hypothetical protein